jgi:hypothetical protein
MAIRIHRIWLGWRHEYLDLGPAYKGADGTPLPRMRFDRNDKSPFRLHRAPESACRPVQAATGDEAAGEAAVSAAARNDECPDAQ